VFVTLQFGHSEFIRHRFNHSTNVLRPLTFLRADDMKIAGPESMAANLTQFVSDIRSVGGHPILLTPLSRRGFNNGSMTINNSLGPWADGKSPLLYIRCDV
jgi:hypothetical protein